MYQIGIWHTAAAARGLPEPMHGLKIEACVWTESSANGRTYGEEPG